MRLFLYTLLFLVASCATQEPLPPPNPIAQSRIAAYEASAPDSRPTGITKRLYNGKPAYLIDSPCCDQFNYLYDGEGRRLCAPSGGFTGAGDGKCTGTLSPDGSVRVRQSKQP